MEPESPKVKVPRGASAANLEATLGEQSLIWGRRTHGGELAGN